MVSKTYIKCPVLCRLTLLRPLGFMTPLEARQHYENQCQD